MDVPSNKEIEAWENQEDFEAVFHCYMTEEGRVAVDCIWRRGWIRGTTQEIT